LIFDIGAEGKAEIAEAESRNAENMAGGPGESGWGQASPSFQPKNSTGLR
jgi:hypothetical protein